AVAFPRDFRAAHDRAAIRRRAAANAQSDRRIRQRYKSLERKYGFAFGGLILRPAASAAEVIHEGEALNHCVASYVDRYACGDTVICVLRRAVEPERPWRTVEIAANGALVQDRGYCNDLGPLSLMTPATRAALDLFWEAWRERKGA
ncbi:MAG: PcfJ domain-containing protein, partial [Clostridia bacterium]|nr:PcfJ domain-containing protein [Clostridia bacterium]